MRSSIYRHEHLLIIQHLGLQVYFTSKINTHSSQLPRLRNIRQMLRGVYARKHFRYEHHSHSVHDCLPHSSILQTLLPSFLQAWSLVVEVGWWNFYSNASGWWQIEEGCLMQNGNGTICCDLILLSRNTTSLKARVGKQMLTVSWN